MTMFWTLTVRRLVGAGTPATVWPKTFGARPDLETGQRMLAVATEGGIVLTVSGPPPAKAEGAAGAAGTAGATGPQYRSTVHAPVK
ncbi:MAG: hypothetical protein ABSB58_10350 [Gemmatimonadales bacterium]